MEIDFTHFLKRKIAKKKYGKELRMIFLVIRALWCGPTFFEFFANFKNEISNIPVAFFNFSNLKSKKTQKNLKTQK